MAYNRLPYQPYDDINPNQPYAIGYPQELPYQEDYQQPLPYDTYNNYPMNPYGEPSYPSDYRGEPPPRRDGRDDYSRDYLHPRGGPLPLDYDEGTILRRNG